MPRFFSDELSRIQRTLLERRAERAGKIVDGVCKTFEDYKHEIGYVGGLDFAVETIRKITGSDGED